MFYYFEGCKCGECLLDGFISRESLNERAASKCIGNFADVADLHAVLAKFCVGVRLEVVCAGDFGNVKATLKSLRYEDSVSNLEIIAKSAEHRTRTTLKLRPGLADELVANIYWKSTEISEVNSNRLVAENVCEMLLKKTRLVLPGLDDPINLDGVHLLLCKLRDVERFFKCADVGNN